jgi:hypothetical protein
VEKPAGLIKLDEIEAFRKIHGKFARAANRGLVAAAQGRGKPEQDLSGASVPEIFAYEKKFSHL